MERITQEDIRVSLLEDNKVRIRVDDAYWTITLEAIQEYGLTKLLRCTEGSTDVIVSTDSITIFMEYSIPPCIINISAEGFQTLLLTKLLLKDGE